MFSKNTFTQPVIYEDEDFFVLHKQSGIPSVPLSDSENLTAVHAALNHFPPLQQNPFGRSSLEPGILHRLDTGTSGLLVFAKHKDEFERLKQVWKNRSVQKYYRAVIELTAKGPSPVQPPFTLDFPLGRSPKSAKRMLALRTSQKIKIRGTPLTAITHILAIQYLPGNLADLEIRIETGIMHQIRCQLSAIGWPILGDTLYRGSPASRFWLHAWRLVLPLRSGKWITLEAQLPPGWPRSP